ncbi:hypothetical protein PG991_012137 [Apiospora marii]|uniref:Uncharacterized protein n=1 Tax=Apiospora marii TaxID=335849 RepID=A0ABR1R8Z6_9PEZI
MLRAGIRPEQGKAPTIAVICPITSTYWHAYFANRRRSLRLEAASNVSSPFPTVSTDRPGRSLIPSNRLFNSTPRQGPRAPSGGLLGLGRYTNLWSEAAPRVQDLRPGLHDSAAQPLPISNLLAASCPTAPQYNSCCARLPGRHRRRLLLHVAYQTEAFCFTFLRRPLRVVQQSTAIELYFLQPYIRIPRKSDSAGAVDQAATQIVGDTGGWQPLDQFSLPPPSAVTPGLTFSPSWRPPSAWQIRQLMKEDVGFGLDQTITCITKAAKPFFLDAESCQLVLTLARNRRVDSIAQQLGEWLRRLALVIHGGSYIVRLHSIKTDSYTVMPATSAGIDNCL